MMRETELRIVVRHPEDVTPDEVGDQIWEAIGPDSWNWDIHSGEVAESRPLPVWLTPGMECEICGEEMWIDTSGVSHHWGPGPDDIDHLADADHVAVREED